MVGLQFLWLIVNDNATISHCVSRWGSTLGNEINDVSSFHILDSLCQAVQFIGEGFNSHISVFISFYQVSVFQRCSHVFINNGISHMLIAKIVVLMLFGLLEGCSSQMAMFFMHVWVSNAVSNNLCS